MRIRKALIFSFVILAFWGCTKKGPNEPLLTTCVDLRALSLNDIQAQIKGRWELRRTTGGIAGPLMEHPVYNNPYLVLSSDHIIMGNDSIGVLVDEAITWAPATYFGSGYVFTTASGSVALVPTGITNDTLKLAEYAADGVTYHYTRSR